MESKMKKEDPTGQKFNFLTYIEKDKERTKTNNWWFQCDCGNKKSIASAKVKSGHTKSCGCLKQPDLTGKKFGKYTFIRWDSVKNKMTYWLCRCDCGVEKVVDSSKVKSGHAKSCGCIRKEDLTGQKFNRYTFIQWDSVDKNGFAKWLCRCDCGVEKVVHASSVKSGKAKSCGCYQKEEAAKRCGKNSPSWNHNITDKERDENKKRNISPKSRKWLVKIFIRDNRTCQICGIINKNIQVHHIYSWHSHKNLRYVTSNGVTLCEQCHKEFHKIYTYKNNTRKQFNKFKKQKLKTEQNRITTYLYNRCHQ